MSEEMYDEGYINMYNNDISPVCIQNMAKRTQDRPQMKWEVMDVRDMTYQDNTFDLIIDKSTIDAILCMQDPYVSAAMVLSECQRVLRTGGVYVSISYESPINREYHFERDHLGFLLKTVRI